MEGLLIHLFMVVRITYFASLSNMVLHNQQYTHKYCPCRRDNDYRTIILQLIILLNNLIFMLELFYF